MPKDYNYNFQPLVKCPYCGKVQHPCISGFGGELSTRVKICHYCEKEYRLITYSFVDTDIESTTCSINNKKDRINYLKRRIHEKINKITNEKAEWAEEFIRIEASTNGKQN